MGDEDGSTSANPISHGQFLAYWRWRMEDGWDGQNGVEGLYHNEDDGAPLYWLSPYSIGGWAIPMGGDDRVCGTYVEYIQGNKPLHGVQKHPLGEWADLRAHGHGCLPPSAPNGVPDPPRTCSHGGVSKVSKVSKKICVYEYHPHT